jgi:hypothetical protein
MTLKPNYLRAVAITYLWIGAFSVVAFAFNRARAEPVALDQLVGFVILGGTFMAVAVCVMFVPRELRYDSDGFACRMIIQGKHSFGWDKLEAYGSGHNVFLLKFKGHQALQISSFGFRTNEWKEFKAHLKRDFPNKKCWIWLGPKPLMRNR